MEQPGFLESRAQFRPSTGTLEFDPADPARSAVSVTIRWRHLNTGVPRLDEDFRSTDFFDTAPLPERDVKSTRVEKGVMKDQLKVTGSLSLHGVSKPVRSMSPSVKSVRTRGRAAGPSGSMR